MTHQVHAVYDTEADVQWEGVDPTEWRDLPDPDPDYEEDDEDSPVSDAVKSVLGFDPDELFEEE